MNLKQNICDTIKECEIKIGYREEKINLYYPEESLLELLPSEKENLPESITRFCTHISDELGDIKIKETKEKGRYCITVPVKGVKYVHENIPASPFLSAFLEEIYVPGRKLEDIAAIFLKFSDNIKIDKVEEKEWGISFCDEKIDAYIYYVEEDAFGLGYHRFTKEAYNALKNAGITHHNASAAR